MTFSKGFLVIGAAYLVIGMSVGVYMGGTQDFTLSPLHAHINLLGFTLMTLFGIVYRMIPALSDNFLAKAHFWLFQIGALLLLVFLFLLLSQRAAGETLGPVLAVVEVIVLLSVLAFLANLWKHS